MWSTRILPIPYIGVALLLASACWAQESVNAATIQQMQKTMREQGIRRPDTLLQEVQRGTKLLKDKMLLDADSLAAADTADTAEEEIHEGLAADTSIYERIIRGETIHPDSVLNTIEIFGYSVFRTETGPRDEAEQVSVSADYLIAPGDEIVITMWGRINEEHNLRVGRDGTVNIPRIGPVPVGGMSFATMESNVVDRIQMIEGVQASVSMGALRSVTVFIVGEVERPGQYTLSALSDVTSALVAAGGIKKSGSLRTIQVRRAGRLLASLDFYDFLLSGKGFNSIRLKSGDVIFVPVVTQMVAVAGNVRRSALYEFKGSASLKDVIDLAGGFSPAAWVSRIQVERFKDNKYQIVLDVEASSATLLPEFAIEDGDMVRVFQIVERDMNAVYLSGNVKREGKYEYTEGLRVSDIITGYTDLLPETYLDYAVIHRLEQPAYTERLLSFSLQRALEEPTGKDNMPLQPHDNIIVYHRDYFEPDRMVMISGAVTTPGKYRLLESMRAKDLILQAGGLTDAASTQRGELYHRSFDGDSVETEKIEFCVSCAMQDDPVHNRELQKLDHVYIREKRGWEETQRVVLKGELVFPGEYVLLAGETLGRLIRRAGGFTSDAYLDAAVFTRITVKQMERKRNEEYIRTLESNIARLSAELAAKERVDEARYLLDHQINLLQRLRDITPIGRVVIDFADPQSFEDFLLEDKDTLFVPRTMSTVSVMGEVLNPSTFQHTERRASVKHYITLSGGMKSNADRKKVYVVRANGSIESGRRGSIMRSRLRPGDVVVVPQKIRYISGYRIFMETIDAVYKIAVTAAVVLSVMQ